MTDRTIYAALDAARQKFDPVVKSRTADTGKYKYRYADLNTVLAAVEPALREEGLGLFQVTTKDGFMLTMVVPLGTTETPVPSLENWIPLPVGLDPQKLGSAITYYRRYGITTLLGLVTEDDDDGTAATTPQDQHDQGGTVGGAITRMWPDGWLSLEDCTQAHNELAAHIKAAPESVQVARKFREENGWPLPVDLFNALKMAVGA